MRLEGGYILVEDFGYAYFLYQLFEIFKGDSLVKHTQAGLPTENDIVCEMLLYAMCT